MKYLMIALLAGAATMAADGKVRVVASYTELANIAQEVGGDRVETTSIARGVDDPHGVEPRPSQVVKLARAALLVRTGMDLDLWLDPLLNAARNSRIMKNASGYVDCSIGVHRLEVPRSRIDPSMGDIHLYGNPHYAIDPGNGKVIARNIAAGLKRVDPAGAAVYDANLRVFEAKVDERMKRWHAMLLPFKGANIVTYHKTWIYFLNRFGLNEFGDIEDRPGIPPSPAHVVQLIRAMKSAHVKVILIEPFRPRAFPDRIARETGAKVVVAPISVGGAPGAKDYLSLIDIAVQGIASALK